ncbi:hypothetical protein E5676_scaffold263G00440 [Cucumis melo var. makuwa]|uniref:Uncharacterized protein n=1 Tax=Cucumis melo var. makuwa TaxID=1194695 RepID=A0A5D3CJK6_CUCMM|nr:hypothetical protein E6C27_scaffold19G00910 [Cucumis melo var. makuwa]TYK11600.1 hypothetical protein E5676_scaffold263G00440 [Cucumis melo var. makuwa]
MATKEEENQCPTFTCTRTSAFKRLSIFTLKKDQPSTSAFDCLKMTNDQQQREMKTLKAKPFHEENNDDKIHSRVSSCMKKKLSDDINTEDEDLHLLSCVAVERIIIFIFSHVLQLRGSSSLSSSMCLQPRGSSSSSSSMRPRLSDVIFIFSHVLQSRESSSYLRTCVAVERIFIFIFTHVLQLRGSSYSSSHMCCNREDHHLHLQCVAAERTVIFIFDMLLPRGPSSSSLMCCWG